MNAPLPALDPYLVSIGEELEDLSRIATAQPFRSAGPVVDRAALETFASARERVRGTVPPALVAAELVADDGVLTEAGRLVHAYLRDPQCRVRVESGRGTPRSASTSTCSAGGRSSWRPLRQGPSWSAREVTRSCTWAPSRSTSSTPRPSRR